MTTRYWREGVRAEFTCPRCGSHEWGSARQADGSWVRSCHGTGCRLRFPEADDYLYFAVDGRRLTTRAAYVRATTTSSAPEIAAATALKASPVGGRIIPFRRRTS